MEIKEDDNMPQQICKLCVGKLDFACNFYNTCHKIQKQFVSCTEKYDTEDNKENTISLTSDVKGQIRTLSESLKKKKKKKIRSTDADSLITSKSAKNENHDNRLRQNCLREIYLNAQSDVSSWTQESIGSQKDDLTQAETTANLESTVTVKQEVDITEDLCSLNPSSALPASSLSNSMVWVHSLDLPLREPDKPKSVASVAINNSPPPGDEAESNRRTSSESGTPAVSSNIGKSFPIVSNGLEETCPPESNTTIFQNNESTASSRLPSSRCKRKRKCNNISELITSEQKQAIDTYYMVDLNMITKCAEKVRSNITAKDKNDIECNLCLARYSRRDKCEVHIWSHLNIKPYKCKKCSFSTVTLSNVRCHIRKSHLKIKPFACKQCPKRYATSALLKEHINTHTGIRPYKCEICGFSSTSRQALNNHMDIHVPNEDIPCSICGKIFHSRIRIRAHMRIHNDNNVTCEICRARLSSEKSLEVHRKKVHIHDYVCDVCSKVFKSRKALHNHMNTHAEAKYKCTKCSNVYKSRHILNEHLLKHEGIRKYRCCICNKTFAQQSHLAAHNKVHSLPSYACSGCGRKYNRRDNMKTHMTRCKSYAEKSSDSGSIDKKSGTLFASSALHEKSHNRGIAQGKRKEN